uniref:(northern house mosquito) hypothetical protein n=1 Tax=Culex pipiens TaxID=7175 RepID=A0A8D8AD71_CULPI
MESRSHNFASKAIYRSVFGEGVRRNAHFGLGTDVDGVGAENTVGVHPIDRIGSNCTNFSAGKDERNCVEDSFHGTGPGVPCQETDDGLHGWGRMAAVTECAPVAYFL